MKARTSSASTSGRWARLRAPQEGELEKIYRLIQAGLAFAAGPVDGPALIWGASMSFSLRAAVAAGLLAMSAAASAMADPELHKAMKAPPPHYAEDQVLVDVLKGSWRPAGDTVRDRARRPLESLTFWGLQPGMTVVDLQPGGGYWTQILAPYAARTGGHYIAGVTDLSNPALSENGKKGRAAFEAKFSDEKLYGRIAFANFGPKSAAFAPTGTVDFVLTSRELHNWAPEGKLDKIMGDAYAALKPGGIFAVEDHRADPGPEAPKWSNGYIATQTVVDAAAKVGFKLEAASEVNANPADLKNYPFGVWTLPPTRQSAPDGKPADPAFDHTKYDTIGESDRMTLRFRKPG
jgi:predicted methyltransferase